MPSVLLSTSYATLDRAVSEAQNNPFVGGASDNERTPQRRVCAKGGADGFVLGAPQARFCCRRQPDKDADLRKPIGAGGQHAAQSLISEKTESSLRLAGKGGALVTCGSTTVYGRSAIF